MTQAQTTPKSFRHRKARWIADERASLRAMGMTKAAAAREAKAEYRRVWRPAARRLARGPVKAQRLALGGA